MNIRDLEYLVAVADHRSFSGAAEACSVSQPTLSAQVKKLENHLGTPLFERTNKRVVITEAGRLMLQSARRILQEVETIEQIAEAARDPLAGRYRLGAFPTLATYLFPQLVLLLREQMPDLQLVLIEEKSQTLVEKLVRGHLDAAFLALPVKEESLRVEPLFDDPFCLAVSEHNELAACAEIGVEILHHHQHRLLLLEEGHCLRDQALEVCEMLGLHDDGDFRATSLETLRQMVRADTGITLFPQIALGQAGDGIHYIPFKGQAPSRTIALASRKTCPRPSVFEVIRDTVTQARSTLRQ